MSAGRRGSGGDGEEGVLERRGGVWSKHVDEREERGGGVTKDFVNSSRIHEFTFEAHRFRKSKQEGRPGWVLRKGMKVAKTGARGGRGFGGEEVPAIPQGANVFVIQSGRPDRMIAL